MPSAAAGVSRSCPEEEDQVWAGCGWDKGDNGKPQVPAEGEEGAGRAERGAWWKGPWFSREILMIPPSF